MRHCRRFAHQCLRAAPTCFTEVISVCPDGPILHDLVPYALIPPSSLPIVISSFHVHPFLHLGHPCSSGQQWSASVMVTSGWRGGGTGACCHHPPFHSGHVPPLLPTCRIPVLPKAPPAFLCHEERGRKKELGGRDVKKGETLEARNGQSRGRVRKMDEGTQALNKLAS